MYINILYYYLLFISWFSARRRRDAGLARASRKTPEQLSLLEEFFKHTHFPTQEQKGK